MDFQLFEFCQPKYLLDLDFILAARELSADWPTKDWAEAVAP